MISIETSYHSRYTVQAKALKQLSETTDAKGLITRIIQGSYDLELDEEFLEMAFHFLDNTPEGHEALRKKDRVNAIEIYTRSIEALAPLEARLSSSPENEERRIFQGHMATLYIYRSTAYLARPSGMIQELTYELVKNGLQDAEKARKLNDKDSRACVCPYRQR
jgi:hypothetical protein